MRLGVISDTHLPRRERAIPSSVFDAFAGVDGLLHAGDLITAAVLEELGAIAPVQSVLGNMDDRSLDLPGMLTTSLGSFEVGMVHDAGPSKGRRERMRKKFPGCRVVVFGHTHEPVIEDDGDLMLLNPGSACDPRGRIPTVALLESDGETPKARIVEV